MKTQSGIGILGSLMAAVVACGSLAATTAQAQPINEAMATPTALPESPPLCGDIRGRAVILQLEDGATYLVSKQNLTVVESSSGWGGWEADHSNSGN